MEALRAHLWWDKGQLEFLLRDQGASLHLVDYLDFAAGAIAEAEIEDLKSRTQKQQ
jgi:hypothetical protein